MTQVFGDLTRLKPSEVKSLERLNRRRVDPAQIVSPDLARELGELARSFGRQVGVLVDRKGHVTHTLLGDAQKVDIPDLGRSRAGRARFRGLRLVHTHLKGEALSRDDLTDLALLRLDLVACVHPDAEGLPLSLEYALLRPPQAGGAEPFLQATVRDLYRGQGDVLGLISSVEAEFAASLTAAEVADQRPRAILVGVEFPNRARKRDAETADAKKEGPKPPSLDQRLAELAELADTAGFNVVDVLRQRRESPDPRYFVGRGKLQEVALHSMQMMADVLIFDHDLSPAQARTIGDSVELEVFDRTQLILEIFARRAKSQVGQLQVTLARLRYNLPRLSEKQEGLSRITGGIGAVGPGETKLEIMRRRAKDRLTHLDAELKRLEKSRRLRRERRQSNSIPVVSIVGYTNAGKSTLLNALTKSDVLAEQRMFATLDTTSRRLRFPEEREVIITDTVGFIRDLPPDLVKAFHSTLEELEDADLLLHVIDLSHPDWRFHAAVTEAVLNELEVGETPVLRVFNKVDQVTQGDVEAMFPGGPGPRDVFISAAQRKGFPRLLTTMNTVLFGVAVDEIDEVPPIDPPVVN
jgi:GTPase